MVPQDQITFYDSGKPVHNSSYTIKNLCPPLEIKTSCKSLISRISGMECLIAYTV